ncbi:cytochrome c biogenesis protein ResB [Geobacter argillaceus]|uniref:ResB-like family protein n=1 Tax=Geobacter argillaceus TaxID=345631 RepID=A0A562WRR8_9BACT|nr:cytochrome c biogenesis protein ResB [Geobacter argillaceus]TWJ32961.1 ResB-like family protein [Geobacter argillaceus]
MTEFNNMPDPDSENEQFPIEPRYHPVHRIPRKIYDFLASSKLAMALLGIILACCVAGVTVVRGQRAGELIFGTLWFNGLLVLLVVNVACCFFGRIWGRRLTIISFGMILFHLSFVAMFAGIIYNSLFSFRGIIRLTEGETLPNGQLQSYDLTEQGRFFNLSHLKGETTLIRMQTGYKVDGADKKVAYEIAVGEGRTRKRGVVYITNSFDSDGFSYFRDKEGYSVLIVLYDKQGRELGGAYVPLQSIKQKNGAYLYTTGTKDGPGSFPFPQVMAKPLLNLQVAYRPVPIKERGGDVFFQVWPLPQPDVRQGGKVLAEGKAAIGEKFDAGEYYLSAREVRYWAAMNVRHEPGKPIVLASLCVGLLGMIITTIGRIRKSRRRGPVSGI